MARSTKGAATAAPAENEGAEESSEDAFRSEYFGVPIIVVGTKADTLIADTAPSMKQARELQGRLRSICLEVGAALVFTSAGAKDQTNCAALKKYLLHRLYPEQVSAELALEVKCVDYEPHTVCQRCATCIKMLVLDR
jgi:chlorite dismutase